jgi:hypothetical protein
MEHSRLLHLAGVPLTEAKASSLNDTEKKFAAAVREYFLNTLKDRIGNPDNGSDVLVQFEDEWGDLPHAVDFVVRSVMKSEKASVRKELK